MRKKRGWGGGGGGGGNLVMVRKWKAFSSSTIFLSTVEICYNTPSCILTFQSILIEGDYLLQEREREQKALNKETSSQLKTVRNFETNHRLITTISLSVKCRVN